MYEKQFDLLHAQVIKLNEMLVDKVDSYFIVGLRRKGFEFDNQAELEKFIKERCRCEDYQHKKMRKYFVDDIPFLMHDYNVDFNITRDISDEGHTFSASMGSMYYV